MTRKTKVINNITYEECGPYCEICGAHRGKYYNSSQKPAFINPHNCESYSNSICPECGQKYAYDEGEMPVLSKKVKEFMLKLNKGLMKKKE